MADLLSSASLLLAVVGVLLGLWYPEVNVLLDAAQLPDFPSFKIDAVPLRKRIQSTLKIKIIPLDVMAFVIVLIFLPATITIIYNSILFGIEVGLTKSLYAYDAVSTALVFVEIFLIVLLAYSLYLTKKLKDLKKKIDQLK